MCCWFLIAFAFAPRAALVLMWLFNDRISAAFGNILLPLAGFFLMPWATLTYVLFAPGGLSVLEIIILIIAVGADLGIWGGGAKKRHSRHLRD
jgi:hypothetical protein